MEYKFDIGFMMAYENGEIEDVETLIAAFQDGINSGKVWQMQGHYGRTARALIDAGYCTPKGEEA